MHRKRADREKELDREVRDHLELDAESRTHPGLNSGDASYAARRDFGNVTLVKEVTREMWAWNSLDRFLHNVRYALRTLRRNPGFAAVAIFTLALGVGANAAMFSITNAVLLRPLAYPDSDRIISITMEDASRGITAINLSFTRLTLLQEQSRTMETVGAYLPLSSNLVTNGDPEQVTSAKATANFFDVLKVAPTIGRGFSPAEDQPGGANVAVLTDAFWHSHFAGQPGVIGQSISIDGRSVEIIGVLPATFRFPFQLPEPQIWFPRAFENPVMPQDRVRSGAAFLPVFARLRAGESLARAQMELDSLTAVYTKTYPTFSDAQRYSVRAVSLKESLIGPLRTSLLVLLGGVGFVLLIGCTNLASLLLARSTARRREMGIRRALGASRARLIYQLLTESLVLSFIGGALGLLLAACTPRLLRLLPPGSLPRLEEITIDSRVVLFSLALCVLTGVIFGLVPALQISGTKPNDALKDSARGSTGGVHAGRSRAALVVGQVAMALVLVSSAGLLIKSFAKLVHVNPGFDPSNVLSISFSLPQSKYPLPPQQAEFYRRLVEAVEAIPNVQSAAANTFLPFSGNTRYGAICSETIPCQGLGKDPIVALRHITPDYFATMRIPLIRGRFFNQFDIANAQNVCVINQSLATQFFSAQDPVGKFIIQSRANIHTEIVGVVGDVKFAGLNVPDAAELYIPQQQSVIPVSSSSLVIRADGSLQPLVASVRAAVAKLDPDLPMSNILSMDEARSTSLAQPRLTTRLIAAFASLALLLAAMGIYGVVAYSVVQRKHEMAIRIALGANRANILKLIAGQGTTLILIGVAIGTIASLALTRFFAAILFQISARDPLTLFGVAALLIAVGLLACYFPARRAMSVDPISALRDD